MNKILWLALFMEKKTFYEIVVRGLLAKKDEWFFGIIIWIFEGKKEKCLTVGLNCFVSLLF